MTARQRSRLELLAAAALFSTAGAAIKSCGLDGWQLAGFRAALAALTLLLLLPAARRGWKWRAVPVAAAYAATAVLFVRANKLTTAAHTIFLQGTSPLYIVLLGPLLLHERVRSRDLWALAALGGGLGFFFLGTPAPLRTARDPVTGNVLAVLTGFTSALMLMGLRWLGRGSDRAARDVERGSAAPAVVLGNLLAFAICLPLALPVRDTGPADWAILAYLGIFQIGLAYVLLLSALRHLRALEASLLLCVEPVLSATWAWIIHAERPGPWAFAGAALILGGTLVQALGETQPTPAPSR